MKESTPSEQAEISAIINQVLSTVRRHGDAAVLGAAGCPLPQEPSTLTLDKFLSSKQQLDEARKQVAVRIGEHTINLLDYVERDTALPEGGMLLVNVARSQVEQFLHPRPTDMILIDRAGTVFLLGGPEGD